MIEKVKRRLVKTLADYSVSSLRTKPRNKVGSIKFLGYTVAYPDAASFVNEYNDIFINRIYDFIADNDTPFIIDAGACIGMSTLFWKLKYPAANIIAFEPDPAIYQILQQNLDANNIDQIKLVKSGLGLVDEIKRFYPDGSDGGSFHTQLGEGPSIELKIERLSNYITQPVDLLKMNIEGAEAEVIQEIEPVLHLVKEIIFEYHAFSHLPQNLGKILTTLDRAGFKYVLSETATERTQRPFNFDKPYRCFNLVYAKRKTGPTS